MFDSKKAHFEKLVRAYSADLYRYAYWISRDRFLAEELVQETYARAWTAFHQMRDEAAAKGWLYKILRNEHARLYERKRLATSTEVDLDSLEDHQLSNVGSQLELREMLHTLPVAYREPLVLQVLGGFSCEEIAGIMSTTPGAVMTRLSRARLMLRRDARVEDKRTRHELP